MKKEQTLQDILMIAQKRIDALMKQITEYGEQSKQMLTSGANTKDVEAIYEKMVAIVDELLPVHTSIFQANAEWASLFYSLKQWKKDREAASKVENTFKMME